MPIHSANNRCLIMERNNGTLVFSLKVPDGWSGPDYLKHSSAEISEKVTTPQFKPTLFKSEDKNAVLGFIANAQFELDGIAAKELEPTLFQSPENDAVSDKKQSSEPETSSISFCVSFNLGEQLFSLDELENVEIQGIRFQKFTGTSNGVPCYAYYTYIEAVEEKFVFDGFFCAYLSEEAFKKHHRNVEAAIASIQF